MLECILTYIYIYAYIYKRNKENLNAKFKSTTQDIYY